MPYREIWEPAEIFLEYKGVTVKHTYKNSDMGRRNTFYYKAMLEEDWFEEQDEDCGHFDIRDIGKGDDHKGIIKQAIDKGTLPVSKE